MGRAKGPAVTEATAEDIDALVDHRHNMFEDIRHRTPEEHLQGDRIYREWLGKTLKEKRAVFFVAKNGRGKVVASGGIWLREKQPRLSDRGGMAPYLLSMYTAPAYRHRGLATAIVARAEEWCRENGYNFVTLHASTMGRMLYSKLGWKRGWEMYKEFDEEGKDRRRTSAARGRHS